MYSLLFRNRLAALGLALLIIIGAVSLVGTENNSGVVTQTAQKFQAQKAAPEKTAQALNQPAPSQAIPNTKPADATIEFLADEELIDAAEGFDPTPMEPGEPKAASEHEEVVIILPKAPTTE
ncbi:MAG: hypothetical protein WAT93_06770 [Pontixanthobacter sp.]